MIALLSSQCAKQEIQTETGVLPFLNAERQVVLKRIIQSAKQTNPSDATLRSSTTYTISEAIDLLDESLNYAYCRPATPLQEALILIDTLVMEMSTSTTVTEAEIASLFNQASDNIGTQYHTLSLTNKQPWVYSVSQYGNLENNELSIIVQLEVAYGSFISDSIAFSSSDDYSYEYQGGMRDATPGPGAPDILKTNLKFAHVPNNPSNKKYFYKPYYLWEWNGFSDIQWCEADGLPNNFHNPDLVIYNQPVKSQQNWNNINDFKLFRQHSNVQENYDECLSGDVEMPFYQHEMSGIIQAFKPTAYVPGSIWVGSSLGYIIFGNLDIPFHNLIVGYYRVAIVDSNDEPIDIPCCN